jgi:hypothetical protein
MPSPRLDAPEPILAFRPEDQALIDRANPDDALERPYEAMRAHWRETRTEASFMNWIDPMRCMGRVGKKAVPRLPPCPRGPSSGS